MVQMKMTLKRSSGLKKRRNRNMQGLHIFLAGYTTLEKVVFLQIKRKLQNGLENLQIVEMQKHSGC